MAFTPTTILPLPSTAHAIFTDLWNDYNTSQPSNTSAFDTGVTERDNGCIVCGYTDFMKRCRIIPLDEPDTWEFMRGLSYIPSNAKSVSHEPRNGVLMCGNHRAGFDNHRFYIRWDSETNEFIAINHSRHPAYDSIHGNVLPFNTNTKRCPFPTTFLWHECRVRGFNPTCDDRPVILKRGRLRGGGFFFGCDDSAGAGEQVQGHDVNATGHDSADTVTFTPVPLTGDNLTAWLNAARQHSSWKGCMVENLSWDGTADENIEKYQREVGVHRPPESDPPAS